MISHKSIFWAKYPLGLIHQVTGADLKTLRSLDRPQQFLVRTFRNLRAGSLVEQLGDHGYLTAAFTDGGWMSREMGFANAFDKYNDVGGHFAAILPRVSDWLSGHYDQPFFLFVHAYDIHCPYVCREPYNSLYCLDHSRHVPLAGRCGKPHLMNMVLNDADLQAISDHYDGGIASADAYVGELLDELRQLRLYDEALIVVTADHGESLGEHDQIGHGGLYLEQLLVPLIVKFPASWQIAPAVIDDPVEMVDVMPTVCDACGLDLPDHLDGRSLLPLIRDGEGGRRYLIAQTTYREGRQAISNPAKRAILVPERWLLIHDSRLQSMELFELSMDSRGHVHGADHGAAEVVELMTALAAHDPANVEGERTESGTPGTSNELKRLFRFPGYVGESATEYDQWSTGN